MQLNIPALKLVLSSCSPQQSVPSCNARWCHRHWERERWNKMQHVRNCKSKYTTHADYNFIFCNLALHFFLMLFCYMKTWRQAHCQKHTCCSTSPPSCTDCWGWGRSWTFGCFHWCGKRASSPQVCCLRAGQENCPPGQLWKERQRRNRQRDQEKGFNACSAEYCDKWTSMSEWRCHKWLITAA